MEEIYNRFIAFGGPEQTDLTGFLIAAARKKALPVSLMSILLEKAREIATNSNGEFMDIEYARILAHAMSQIPVASRPMVYQMIDMVTETMTPLASSTAEIYTTLVYQQLEKPEMLHKIITHASAAPPYRPQNQSQIAEPQPGMTIVVGYGPWIYALAVLGTQRALPPKAIEVLESHSNNPIYHDVIVRALIRQPAWRDKLCWKNNCSLIFKDYQKDAAKRQLTSDLLAEKLSILPQNDFQLALKEIRKERAIEIEPEVRIALGLAIVNARLARVRTAEFGIQLFE